MFNTHVIATAVAAWMIGIPAVAPSPVVHAAPKPSATHSTPAPQLDIAVTDGRTSAAPGDQLTYTIKIRNLGTTTATDLQISESLPSGWRLVSADRGGLADATRVTWSLSLKPGEQSTLSTVGRVGQTPATLLRLATVACATEAHGTKPLVCATHSDLLPASAAAPVSNGTTSHRIWYLVGVLALAALGLAGFLRTRNRRRKHRYGVPTENTDYVSTGVSHRD